MEFFTGHSAYLYLAGVLTAGAILEHFFTWRRTEIAAGAAYGARWLRAGALAFYGHLALNFAPLLSVIGVALIAQEQGVGLFNQIEAPLFIQTIIAIIILDAVNYTEHRILHRWPLFWRLHRAHHSDPHVDVSTSLRFHPFEAIFRAAIEAPVFFIMGLPPEGAVVFFAVIVIFNTFTHANLRLSTPLQQKLGLVIITPNVHRLHHTAQTRYQNVNFGTIFSFWDRLFDTYRGPEALSDDIAFGLNGAEAPDKDSFTALALDPFRPTAPAHKD